MFQLRWSNRIIFLAFFTLALTAKLCWTYLYFPPIWRYEYEMVAAARSIYLGQGIGNVFSDTSGPTAHVAPLYAYYLAGLFAIFGTGQLSIVAREVSSLVASSATVALLPALSRQTGLPRGSGIIAAFVLALSPFTILYEANGNWETTFAGFGLVVTFLAMTYFERRTGSRMINDISIGAVTGVLTLLSPSVAIGIIAVAFTRGFASERTWGRSIYRSCVTAVACGLVLTPWVARNYIVLGGFVPVRSNFGLNLYVGNHSRADGTTFGFTARNYTFSQRYTAGNPAELARYQEVGELAYMKEKRDQTLAWIRQNPSRFVWLTYMRFRWYWFPPRDMPLPRLLWYNLLGIGSFAGAAYLFWKNHPYRWQYLMILLLPSIPYMVTHVDFRYRYPTIWLSALLTSCLVVVAWRFVVHRFLTSAKHDKPPAVVAETDLQHRPGYDGDSRQLTDAV